MDADRRIAFALAQNAVCHPADQPVGVRIFPKPAGGQDQTRRPSDHDDGRRLGDNQHARPPARDPGAREAQKTMNAQPRILESAVVLLGLGVLLADLWLPSAQKRFLGYAAAAGLAGVLG